MLPFCWPGKVIGGDLKRPRFNPLPCDAALAGLEEGKEVLNFRSVFYFFGGGFDGVGNCEVASEEDSVGLF